MSRLKSSEPRTMQLNLSLTASEFESIRLRAEAVGMRTVHFGRAILLDQGRKPASGHADNAADNLARLIHAQLARLGNNLNQLVRRLHETGDPLPPDLEPLLADIRQLIAKVSAGVPR